MYLSVRIVKIRSKRSFNQQVAVKLRVYYNITKPSKKLCIIINCKMKRLVLTCHKILVKTGKLMTSTIVKQVPKEWVRTILKVNVVRIIIIIVVI